MRLPKPGETGDVRPRRIEAEDVELARESEAPIADNGVAGPDELLRAPELVSKEMLGGLGWLFVAS